jgi:hypothetical protein
MLYSELAERLESFVSWLERYGETSYDFQTVYAGSLGKRAKSLSYSRHKLGVFAVAPLVFGEAFLPHVRMFFWKKQRFPIADAVRIGIISAVLLHKSRFSQGPTPLAANRWNRLHQRQQFGHVVPIRLRDTDRKGNPLSFSDEVMFCALFPAIRGVRPRFRPPNTGLTEELSTTAREKSILSAHRSRVRSTSWIFCQAPCFCQA